MTSQQTMSNGVALRGDAGALRQLAARSDPAFVLGDAPASEVQAQLLVVPVFEGPGRPVVPDLDLSESYAAAQLHGAAEEDLLLTGRRGDPFRAQAVLLVGLGRREQLDADALRRAARRVGHRYSRFADLATTLPRALPDVEAGLRATVEGLCAGGYRFRPYGEGGRSTPAARTVQLLVAESRPVLVDQVAQVAAVERAVAWSRDLVNIPAGFLTPADLAEHARRMAEDSGLAVRIWDDAALRKGGFGGILGVGSGSRHESRLIDLRYVPPSGTAERVIGLSGKGVTFDSGGLALKKVGDMLEMKSDMAGAACVMATMRAIAELAPDGVEVVAAVPSAENMPGSHAVRPGDVLTHRNGLTTEVVDPDCEGRLILADALAYLAEQRPTAVLDTATLTYACIAALGTEVTAAVGNDRALMDAVCRAGAAVGEPVWELPLWQPYRRQLESPVADQRNEGRDDIAGAIVPALFLEGFVGGTPWVHLDTGGTAFLEEPADDLAAGGTGVLVRTLCRLLLDQPVAPAEREER